MRILVTGVKGQLGYDVVRELKRRGHEVLGSGRGELSEIASELGVTMVEMDITDESAVMTAVAGMDAVVHCASYTAVDAAEDDYESCSLANVDGTRYVASACKANDAKLVYISTDYVFDGMGERPWKPDDEPDPLNAYGKSKYEGELEVQKIVGKHFIIRISWAFGKNSKNFVKTMLKLGRTREQISIVDDQTGSPTYTVDLAVLIADMLLTDKYGIYHASNEGICSWYEFANEIFRQAGIQVKAEPVSSSDYPSRAKRPANSRLDKSKLDENGFRRLPDWKDALGRYLKEICS